MIQFVFKYNSEPIATIENVSRFSNKEVWNRFEEVVTQQIKSVLINELHDIREKMEEGNLVIECDYDQATEDYKIAYTANPALVDLIESRLK